MIPSLPGYQVGDRIGADRWGSAYRATRAKAGQPVELHIIDPTLLPSPDALDRIVEQARGLSSIQGPNVAALLAAGTSDSGAYYVLQAVDGEPLSKWLERQPKLPERACLKIATDVARALEILEAAGTRHGRVRPEDVIVARDGTAVLRHAGVAEVFRANAPDLFENVIDSSYAAPEESQGRASGTRSDQYALGVLLRRCLTGSTDGRLDGVSSKAAAVISKLMTPAPEQRYAAPADLVRALTEAAAAPPPTTRPAVPPTQRQAPVVAAPVAKPNRTPLVIAGAAVALAAAAVIVVVLATSGGQPPPPTPRVGETPERPAPGRPDTAEQARQALNLLRSNQIASLLRAGSYRQAIRALEDFERSYPQATSEVATVRADIFSRAQREYEDLRMAALARRDAGVPSEGAAMLREARPRFVGISDLEARMDALATEMDTAGGGRPAPSGDILSVAKGQLSAAKDMYKRGDESGSATLLEEAGFKAEEARVKFQALVDVVSGLQAEEVRAKLRETIQLVKLINDARKRVSGKPVEPTPTPVVKGPAPEPEPTPTPTPTPEPFPELKPPPPGEKPGEKEAAALFAEAAQASKEGKHDKALDACRKLLKDFGTTDVAAAKRAEIESLAKIATEELEKEAARELSKGVKDGRFYLGKHEYPEAQSIFAPLKEKYSAYEAYKKHDKEIEKALERCAEEIEWAEKALITGSEDKDDWGSGWGGEVRITGTDKAAKGKGAVKLRINAAQPRYDEPGVFPGAGVDMPKETPSDAVAVSVWLKSEGKAANVDIELWLGEGTSQRTFYATVSLSSTWKEYKVSFSGLRPRYFTREVQYSGGPKFDVRDVRRLVLSNSTTAVTIEFSVDEVRFVKR